MQKLQAKAVTIRYDAEGLRHELEENGRLVYIRQPPHLLVQIVLDCKKTIEEHIMAKLIYQSPKWDKQIAEYKKGSAKIAGESTGLNNFNLYVQKFINTTREDYIELYRGLSSAYYNLAKSFYLREPENPVCVDYIFLEGFSFAILDTLLIHNYPTQRKHFNDFMVTQQAKKYALIATNQCDLEYLRNGRDIISYTVTGQYQKAKKLMDKVVISTDYQGHLIDYCYVKNIYECIFNKDEEGFNFALAERIKRYRRNMVGYFPIIDVVSIALIKMAKLQNITCTVNVVEIPSFFVSSSYQFSRDDLASKLPFYEEVMKLLREKNWAIF